MAGGSAFRIAPRSSGSTPHTLNDTHGGKPAMSAESALDHARQFRSSAPPPFHPNSAASRRRPFAGQARGSRRRVRGRSRSARCESRRWGCVASVHIAGSHRWKIHTERRRPPVTGPVGSEEPGHRLGIDRSAGRQNFTGGKAGCGVRIRSDLGVDLLVRRGIDLGPIDFGEVKGGSGMCGGTHRPPPSWPFAIPHLPPGRHRRARVRYPFSAAALAASNSAALASTISTMWSSIAGVSIL